MEEHSVPMPGFGEAERVHVELVGGVESGSDNAGVFQMRREAALPEKLAGRPDLRRIRPILEEFQIFQPLAWQRAYRETGLFNLRCRDAAAGDHLAQLHDIIG